jgi:hypothetical protein
MEPDIIAEIGKGRLRWLGRVESVPQKGNVEKVSKNIPERKRSFGKSRKRWVTILKKDLKKMGVRG